ncbi:MAG TPA: serine hydrolase domain-containing protein [Gemmatimonadota bacterium]|nr:serine hydrolase domain-containing protein [Gemmatimonadota bacterium]
MTGHRRVASALLLAAASFCRPWMPAALHAQVAAQPAAVRTVPDRFVTAIEAGRSALDSLRLATGIPGLSIAVGVGGDVVWSEGLGFADLENRIPVTPLTKFRIGSVSKAVSSIAVGKLVESRALDLDATVQTYVPGFPEKRWPITTRLVAGHLAGIRHYRGVEFESARHYSTVTQALSIFASDSLLFEPGTRWSYSSYGWNLVSAVVEGAADEPFLAYVKREVFDAAGLSDMVADQVDSLVSFRTRYYQKSGDGAVLNAPFVDNSNKWAGGGFLSTPTELAELAFALFEGEPLERATLEILWTPQRLRDGSLTEYGIGWYVSEDAAGRRMVGHGGGSIGGTTLFWLWPEQELVVALTANLSEAPLGGRAFAERLGTPFLAAGEKGAESD